MNLLLIMSHEMPLNAPILSFPTYPRTCSAGWGFVMICPHGQVFLDVSNGSSESLLDMGPGALT